MACPACHWLNVGQFFGLFKAGLTGFLALCDSNIWNLIVTSGTNNSWVPKGHNTSNWRRFDVDITSIHWKKNIDELLRCLDNGVIFGVILKGENLTSFRRAYFDVISINKIWTSLWRIFFNAIFPAGTRSPEGSLKVLTLGTYRGPSGDPQGTNTKTDDLIKKLIFGSNSPCISYLFLFF